MKIKNNNKVNNCNKQYECPIIKFIVKCQLREKDFEICEKKKLENKGNLDTKLKMCYKII